MSSIHTDEAWQSAGSHPSLGANIYMVLNLNVQKFELSMGLCISKTDMLLHSSVACRIAFLPPELCYPTAYYTHGRAAIYAPCLAIVHSEHG